MEAVRETSASPSCKNSHSSGDITGEAPDSKVSHVRHRKSVTLSSVSVSAQDMEERLDMSSPRGVLEDCIRSLGSETDSSKPSTSDSEAQPNPRGSSQWRGIFHLLKTRSIRHLPSFTSLSVPKLSRRKSRCVRENVAPALNPSVDTDSSYFKSSWKNFTLSELETATNNFSFENVIGRGGYAEVYKGCLEGGQLVAIKRLTRGTQEERIGDFLSELGIIVHVNHPNTAKLIGYGIEGGMHLVLQLSPHGSLASLLYGSKEKLKWGIRYKVALGTAEGLLYLHESCQRRIIHRDIKAANILLTEQYDPQICDFGLAKWLPEQWTHHTVSKFEGTFGYLAPEYSMHGIVDEKTDVFAFGVLLLELISGRRALDNSQQSLVIWAKPLLNQNDIRELVDPSLADTYDSQQMNRVVLTASLCIQQSSDLRPRMSLACLNGVHMWVQVVQLLRGDEGSLECVKQSQRPLPQRTYSEELFDAEEYNSTKYLNDLNRHKLIALEL
ncbi:hypothetical protein HHK36_026624 [Tetracentron sinense]|uniref:non-specific serine/threonine protein kinase n=1 Tax=Tetracentron sinense TaxID=13715 RepID=A0A835D2D5_TETSI|nr:hypothetical protein HHK36_026624 [Tetracentron sinense]